MANKVKFFLLKVYYNQSKIFALGKSAKLDILPNVLTSIKLLKVRIMDRLEKTTNKEDLKKKQKWRVKSVFF